MTASNNTSSKRTALVNPVEMLLRIRKHAASQANNKNDCDTKDDGIYTDEELHTFISMYVDGEIPDYQMSAWLMAVCFCPLTPRETATLTQCYAESGNIVEWPCPTSRPPLVDKHSSGGVGDKVSLVLAPLAAACGVCVPMMAGRGLGHTGGTIDKLETSFPGYKATLESLEEFSAIVLGAKDSKTEPIGCSIVQAGPDLCPADGRIYALRDVTSTVSCLPLITASIMSKKIAENPDSLVLDVKYGNGAFRETIEDARTLAESMVAVGEANGLNPTIAFLTDMNHPLGRAVGNWVEVAECIDILKGNLKRKSLALSKDLITLIVIEVGQMLHQSCSGREEDGDSGQPYDKFKTMSLEECIHHAYQVLDSGVALDKFRRMLLAQGAESIHLEQALNTPEAIPLAPFCAVWKYEETENPEKGDTTYIADIPAKLIGDVAVDLGTGRRKAGEKVDGQAGLVFEKQTGDYVVDGDVIATLYTNRSQQVVDDALERVKNAVVYKKGTSHKASNRIVTHIVTKEGGTKKFETPSFLLDE